MTLETAMSEIKWIRTAFWHGAPRPGAESQWRAAIEQEMLPAFRTLPGVHNVKACWPAEREDNAPQIACQFIIEFACREDCQRMRTSPERAALGPLVERVVALFDGYASHIEYQVS
jgi:antibiotic biosynthesis monooxygenase (ABM) superfamily enzyme